jgi:hypothetical protein
MNRRLQLPPICMVRESQTNLSLSEWWKGGEPNVRDAEFFRSWLVYDSDFDLAAGTGRLNWNTLLGLALSIGVSVSFWAGAGAALVWLWK